MQEHERAAIEKAEKLTAELEKSPMLRKLRAEEKAETLAKRTEAAGKIEVLKTEMDAVIPKLLAGLEAQEVKYKKAKAALDTADGEYNAAKYELSIESNNFDTAISTQEQTLIESADPLLDEAIDFFRKKFEWLRSPGRISRNSLSAERNIFTETVTVTQETNLPAIKQALGYCQAAIRELELMKLSPALDLQKIEAMKKAIPDISVYSEYTGGKAMEGSKGQSFASYFPSADQTDWQVSKLLEKGDKILSAPKRARA